MQSGSDKSQLSTSLEQSSTSLKHLNYPDLTDLIQSISPPINQLANLGLSQTGLELHAESQFWFLNWMCVKFPLTFDTTKMCRNIIDVGLVKPQSHTAL